MYIELTHDRIDADSIWSKLSDVDAGANNVFLGTTRRMTGDEETAFLVYEAYPEMAHSELGAIGTEAQDRWQIKQLVIIHRLGRVDLGEASVAIGISSAHRIDTLEATLWILNELKKRVPIWKQENWADGRTQWIHP